jgi:hypothetical protein
MEIHRKDLELAQNYINVRCFSPQEACNVLTLVDLPFIPARDDRVYIEASLADLR